MSDSPSLQDVPPEWRRHIRRLQLLVNLGWGW
jgi:hypothetical protein